MKRTSGDFCLWPNVLRAWFEAGPDELDAVAPAAVRDLIAGLRQMGFQALGVKAEKTPFRPGVREFAFVAGDRRCYASIGVSGLRSGLYYYTPLPAGGLVLTSNGAFPKISSATVVQRSYPGCGAQQLCASSPTNVIPSSMTGSDSFAALVPRYYVALTCDATIASRSFHRVLNAVLGARDGPAAMMAWIISVLAILTGGAGGFLSVAAMEYLGDARTPTPMSVVRAMISLGALGGLACGAALSGSSLAARRHLDLAVPTLAAAVGLCLGLDGPHLLMRAFGYEALGVPIGMSGEQLVLGLASLFLAIPRTLVSSLFFSAVATGAWSWFRRRRWNEDVSWPPARVVRITLAFSGGVALVLVIATLVFFQSCWGTREL